MKYILVLLSALIIIFGVIFVLKQSEEKNIKMPKTEETANIAALIKQLKPLVDEVSLKNFQSDDEVYSQYKDKLLMIDTLSEQVIDNITAINTIKDYNYADYITLRFSIKMDLLSILSVITPSQYKDNMTDENITHNLLNYTALYFISLASLYNERINVSDYLKAYKEPYYSHEQGMQEYKRQLSFLNNVQKITDTLNFSENDKKIKETLIYKAGQSYSLYSINSGLYENISQFAQWEIYKNKYILDDYQQTFLNNLYKYKSVKALKNVYLAKIYMQFMMLDDKYSSMLSNLAEMEQEYPEEFYEESTLFVSGCTNPAYLFENTLNKCIDFIKNAETKEDAFSYLEDENIAGYVMIDDKICASKDDYGYKFYNNDNIMCETLKEKLGYTGHTNIDELAYHINNIRPYMDNITKEAENERAKGESLDSILFIEGFAVVKLLDEAVESVYEVTRIKKYDENFFKLIKYWAKTDLAAYIYNVRKPESKMIAETYTGAVNLYTNEIYHLYNAGINVDKFLDNYASSEKAYEEIKQYNLQEMFIKVKDILKQYNLQAEDEKVAKDIFKNATESLSYYLLLYKQNEKEYSEVWDKIISYDDMKGFEENLAGNFFRYRMAKVINNLYISKISAELLAVDSKYLSKAEQIFEHDAAKTAYLKEIVENQNKMLREACKHTKFLSADRQEECIDIIKNKSGDEAFAYLEDSNIKGYVIIDDIVCAKKEKSEYKFYENNNKLCETLKEKFAN